MNYREKDGKVFVEAEFATAYAYDGLEKLQSILSEAHKCLMQGEWSEIDYSIEDEYGSLTLVFKGFRQCTPVEVRNYEAAKKYAAEIAAAEERKLFEWLKRKFEGAK